MMIAAPLCYQAFLSLQLVLIYVLVLSQMYPRLIEVTIKSGEVLLQYN